VVFYGLCLILCKSARYVKAVVVCSVVQIELFGCEDVEKMVGVLVVILYLLIAVL
jgi:hypothetical protein